MKRFYLRRTEDVSGVSGVGNVAEGVQFDDGQAVLLWLSGEDSSIGIYRSVEKLISKHGHNGATEIVWIDDASSNVVVDKEECHTCCDEPSTHYLVSNAYSKINDSFFAEQLFDNSDVEWLKTPLTLEEQEAVQNADKEELTDWDDV